MKIDFNNTVIEALTYADSINIKSFWVKQCNYQLYSNPTCPNKEDRNLNRYYGKINGEFGYYTLPKILQADKLISIISLPLAESSLLSENMLDEKTEINLEDYLKENGFELDTYYGDNKRYCKTITDYQNLYVRIFASVNKILEVEYEHIASCKFEREGCISFETIDTIEQLKLLISALKRS